MTTDRPTLDLDAIEARANTASRGPWCTDGHEIYQGAAPYTPGLMEWIGETCRPSDVTGSEADAAFIAHARTDVPALLAEVRRLRAAVPSASGDLRDRIAQAVRDWLNDASKMTFGEAADAVLAVLPAPADRTSVCICGHPEHQHFEDSCITEITGCTCGDYLTPEAAAELIARLSDGARDNRVALSEALGLGNGAPWSAIRERAGDVDRLQQRVLDLEAEQAKLQNLLATENKRANDAIDREEAAEQAALEAGAAPTADTVGLCGYCGVPRESHHHGYVSTAAALAAAPHRVTASAPATAVRAAVLREAADEADRAGGLYAGRGDHDRAGAAFALMEAFRRMADEAQQAGHESLVVAYSSVGSVYCTECIDNPDDPSYRAAPVLAGQLPTGRACDECGRVIATEPTVQEPTQLRWGLDDVQYGDDDTTTVMLSGPRGEPYWLELDPERRDALRDALTAPEDDEPTEEQIVRGHVTTVHLIGEQLADVESWLWERLAEIRAGQQQAEPEEPGQ